MKRFRFSSLMLVVGLLFIYLPMLILVIYSFNASKLVTVWGGWSIKWYVGLLDNTQLMGSVVRSLEIACYTAIAAVALGTLAAFVLTRITHFKGRTLFGGLVTAPLVMPEVITGISSLMFFILLAEWIGWPGQRGFTTVTLAHITFSMVFVTTIVQARMLQSDRSIEEAAMVLGSRPWQVFRAVTLLVIFPAIMSGWLLAFTISLDDVVITSFTTGPGSTTLPLLIWSKVKLGVTPDINALATLMVSVVAVGVVIAGIVMNRAEHRRQRDEQMAFRANG